MDYKDENNKEEFLKFKEATINNINNLFNKESEYKKSVIFTYWLNDYWYMLKNEKTFKSIYLPVYKRGQIIEVNFGFNIGNEFGGQHYAIVLNNNDQKSNSILTVAPLSSATDKIHHTEIKLNYDFKDKLLKSIEEKLLSLDIELEKIEELDLKIKDNISYLSNRVKKVHTLFEDKSLKDEERALKLKEYGIDSIESLYNFKLTNDIKLNELQEQINYSKKQTKKIISKLKTYNFYKKKLAKIKENNKVKLNQITSISKLRISIPKSLEDPLYNLIIPEEEIQKIDNKLKKLFLN